MAAYPDVLTQAQPVIPFGWAPEQIILKSQFANGEESRRLVWSSNRKRVVMQYRALPLSEMQLIYDFFRNMNGPFQRFSFFFPQELEYTREFCGTVGSSSTTVINLPSKGAYNDTLYLNGSPTTGYTLSTGTGPDGEDRAIKSSGSWVPGDTFHFSFIGRLKIVARFDENPIEIEEVKDQYATFKVNLVDLGAKTI